MEGSGGSKTSEVPNRTHSRVVLDGDVRVLLSSGTLKRLEGLLCVGKVLSGTYRRERRRGE